jgi:hypothetical protein
MTAWDWTSELIRYGPGRKGSTRASEPVFPWHGSAAGGARPNFDRLSNGPTENSQYRMAQSPTHRCAPVSDKPGRRGS